MLTKLLRDPLCSLIKAVRLTLFEWLNRNHTMVAVIDGLDDVGQGSSEFLKGVLEILRVYGMGETSIKVLFTGRSNEPFRDIEGFKFIDYSTMLTGCLFSLNILASRYHNILSEYEGSFEWLWSHPEYLAWSESQNSSLLFVKGKPGSGKSTLCKFFLRRVLDRFKARNMVGGGLKPIDIVDQRLSLPGSSSCALCHRSAAAVVASFFYSVRDDETSHVMMLKVLLYQILHQNADFFYHYHSEFTDNQGNWTFDSLVGVLMSLGDHPVNERIYLLIDAFDESDVGNGERKKLVESLRNLCTKCGNCVVKVFFASRPVNEVLDTKTVRTLSLHDHTKSDIAMYTSSFLQELSISAEIPEDTASRIVERAEGVFVWFYLVGQILIQLDQKGLLSQSYPAGPRRTTL
ncbi:hypothetical protein K440DRAFT_13264 [Wilcoxina mikolae CBS 423.85]|nr:hypothetical protein K440DRAFT_13264 [Wilcoxina mikolae CBS 423.85]